MARTIEYDINVGGDGLRTLGQMEDNLTSLNDEIKNVDRNSAAFDELSGQIQKANVELEKANLEIEGFTDERKVKAFQGSIDVFTGSVEAFAGIATQLGFANEEFEETVTQLLAVSATANGIRTASQGLVDLREALRGSAAAQRVFNAVANANPYVIAAVALVALTAAFIAFSDSVTPAEMNVEDLTRELRGFRDEVPKTIDAFDDYIETLKELKVAQDAVADEAEYGFFDAFFDKIATSLGVTNPRLTAYTLALSKAQNTQTELDDAYENRTRLINEEKKSYLNDEIARLGDEGDEDTILGKKRQVLEIEQMYATTLDDQLRIKRELEEIDERLIEIDDLRGRTVESVNEITAEGIKMTDTSIEQKEVEIKVNDTVADNQTSNIDAQIGALNDFASQAAVLAEESKGLAIAAVITNAAVAGIAAVRSWTEDGPFGPVGNAIAAGVQVGIIGIGAGLAIDSIVNAGNGATSAPTASFAAGPSAATPRTSAGPTPSIAPLDTTTQIAEEAMNTTVMAVVAQGSITDSMERAARSKRLRTFGG